MARCLPNEKDGRIIFYGAMVAEGIIALIWAAAGCAVYGVQDGVMLALSIEGGGNAISVYNICKKTILKLKKMIHLE